MTGRTICHTKPSRLNGNPNAKCHSWLGGVQQVGDETMGTPKVFGVYWDNYFVKNPDAKAMLDDFLSFIVTSTYMQPLTQYGISPAGTFLGSFVVDSTVVVPPNPLDEGHIVAFLEKVIDDGKVPQPDGEHYDSLYVIIAPQSVILQFEGFQSGVGGQFNGYHSAALKGGFLGIGKQNLFYAVLPWPLSIPPGVPIDVVSAYTTNISHEFVEAVTDRSGNGWISSNGCEIADVCEQGGTPTNGGSITLNSWSVTKFWSNKDNTCVPANSTLPCLTIAQGNKIASFDGFRTDALTRIQQMISEGQTFLNVVFAPNGAWVVIGAFNYRWYSTGFPADATGKIEEMIAAGNTFETIVFARNGAWIVIGAGNYRWYSAGLPGGLVSQTEAMIAAGKTLTNIVIAPNLGWIVIGAGNYRWYGGGVPQYAIDISEAVIATGAQLVTVVFLPNWSAVAIGSSNLPITGPDAPDRANAILFPPLTTGPLLNFVVAG